VETTRRDDHIRLAEPVAALSLATDLGTGQPLEHQLGVCLSTLELADRLGCSAEERSEVYFVALLAHLGCSAAAPYLADWAGGDEIHFQSDAPVLGPAAEPPEVMRHLVRRLADDRPLHERARHVVRALAAAKKPVALMGANLCEGAPLLAQRLHLPGAVARALGQLLERWDGNGVPNALAGEELSRSVRIVRVAVDLVGISHVRDPEAATDALKRRRGRGYDPQVVDAALAEPEALLRAADASDAWERVIQAEPLPVATISRAGLKDVARALGEFVDLKVSFLYGHSTRVAEIAATAAAALGCSDAEVDEARLAGFLHDLGRVAVPNGIWEKPGRLSAHEWERVRLHPYYTERILERSPTLAPLGLLAGSHHERLDGSGYHRGASAPHLGVGARVLAAADAYDAMTHDRPYRHALRPRDARSELGEMVRAGTLDKRTLDAVLQAAGVGPTEARQGYPAGLTEREVEVLRLLAQGRTNKEIAAALVISQKTVGHHVEHIYTKAGVSTRVGAALFAMQHDLVE
jgi:HD-GYP domain-containing protein (c-di-GMP phosphodiesterase class II)